MQSINNHIMRKNFKKITHKQTNKGPVPSGPPRRLKYLNVNNWMPSINLNLLKFSLLLDAWACLPPHCMNY